MRLLVATYDYPRPGAPGANRWAVMTKYLRRLGHEVTVVTAVGPGMSPGEEDGVLHTSDLSSSATLRRLLRRPPATGGVARAEAANARQPALLTKVIVPDAYLVGWNPWAARAVKRLVHERQIDCLITSGPPESTHVLGLLPRRERVAWIADFRDGWLFEPPHGLFPTAPQRALARRLERRVATRADAVVGVTRPIVEDLRNRLGVPAELVSNGWDPETALASATVPEIVDARRFTFLHTGAVSGVWGRDPRPLLAAVRLLLETDPGLAARIEVVFVGAATAGDLRLLHDPALQGVVRYAGSVERSEVFALQRAAGALLLLTSDRVSEATGKLFEYLGSRRPIIALAEHNEAARIVAETGTGVCVAPRDVPAIAEQLRLAVEGQLEQHYAPRAVDRYRYPAPAERIAALAARAVSARSAGDGVE
jgi:glycosyltransferase involved in cell wall biosynthesis